MDIKLGELRVYQEYQFRDLESGWLGTVEFMRTSDNPLGLEQLGTQALCIWYHCKSLDASWIISAIGYPNGQLWIDNTYQFYSKIKDLKRPKFLRVVLDHAKVQSSQQQREMISFLTFDASKSLAGWSKAFAGQTASAADEQLP